MTFQKYRGCGSSILWWILSSKCRQFKSTIPSMQFQNPKPLKTENGVGCFFFLETHLEINLNVNCLQLMVANHLSGNIHTFCLRNFSMFDLNRFM